MRWLGIMTGWRANRNATAATHYIAPGWSGFVVAGQIGRTSMFLFPLFNPAVHPPCST